MARVVLVTGGNRSGKSSHALKIAQDIGGSRVFVATCPDLDEELRARIRKHREGREGKGWDTIEATRDLAAVLSRAGEYRVVLVDCLTLWLGNLLHEAEQTGRSLEEGDVVKLCEALLLACSRRQGTVIFVTNEVGWGIVPENPLARRFRDLSGRCNQVMAAGANEVILMACGLPIWLKKGE